jgi:hypothetical protein
VFNVYALTELTETQVTAFAEAIVPDRKTAAFTSSPPAGYDVRYEGKGIVPAAWSTTLHFERDGAQISVVIKQLSTAELANQEVSEKFGSPGYKRVKVGEADALEFTSRESVALLWNTTVDVGVNLQTDGLSEESALASGGFVIGNELWPRFPDVGRGEQSAEQRRDREHRVRPPRNANGATEHGVRHDIRRQADSERDDDGRDGSGGPSS